MTPKVQRAINMLKLHHLERLYADRARPRFGKRSGHMMKNALDGSDYDGQNQDGDEGDYYSKRR